MHSITERIIGYNQGRLADTVRFKYEAMAENMFRFFRGTNHIFHEDLSKLKTLPPSPLGWTSGDLHIENFGSFKSDNRLVYFDLNDFDEGLLAPVAWEVYRMAVSIFIAFASLDIGEDRAEHMVNVFLKAYGESLARGKADYIEPQTAKGVVCDFLKIASQKRQKDSLAKKTIVRKDKLELLLDDARHIELKKKQKKEVMTHLQQWLSQDSDSPYNYKVKDIVFRLAGTASLGLNRYAVLLKSSNQKGEKYLLLDMKEAIPSSLAPYSPAIQPAWLL